MAMLSRLLLPSVLVCTIVGDVRLRGASQKGSDVADSDNTSEVEVEPDWDALELESYLEIQASLGAKVDIPPFAMLGAVRDTMPPPTCQCVGWNEHDGYRNGASATDKELCMSPWGGPHTPCYPLNWNGQCNWGARKCANPPAAVEPSAPQNSSSSDTATGFANASREVNATDPDDEPCLCIFDVDRTLTAKQFTFNKDRHGNQQCPGSRPVWGAQDNGYGWGTLTLASGAAEGISKTDCGKCYVGICSHGSAGDRNEKTALANEVLDAPLYQDLAKKHWDAKLWSYRIRYPARSPLVAGVPEGQKQFAVDGILAWYWSKGVQIARERTWFFDDKVHNSANFAHTGINARQISCASRDWTRWPKGAIGFCGGTQQEYLRIPGVHDCEEPPSQNLTRQHARRFNESRRNESADSL